MLQRHSTGASWRTTPGRYSTPEDRSPSPPNSLSPTPPGSARRRPGQYGVPLGSTASPRHASMLGKPMSLKAGPISLKSTRQGVAWQSYDDPINNPSGGVTALLMPGAWS